MRSCDQGSVVAFTGCPGGQGALRRQRVDSACLYTYLIATYFVFNLHEALTSRFECFLTVPLTCHCLPLVIPLPSIAFRCHPTAIPLPAQRLSIAMPSPSHRRSWTFHRLSIAFQLPSQLLPSHGHLIASPFPFHCHLMAIRLTSHCHRNSTSSPVPPRCRPVARS